MGPVPVPVPIDYPEVIAPAPVPVPIDYQEVIAPAPVQQEVIAHVPTPPRQTMTMEELLNRYKSVDQ
jgi:hypothetical protein